MSAPATSDDFVEVIQKSGLVALCSSKPICKRFTRSPSHRPNRRDSRPGSFVMAY